jgi:hypothetical protein
MKPIRIEKAKVWREDVWPVRDQPALQGSWSRYATWACA